MSLSVHRGTNVTYGETLTVHQSFASQPPIDGTTQPRPLGRSRGFQGRSLFHRDREIPKLFNAFIAVRWYEGKHASWNILSKCRVSTMIAVLLFLSASWSLTLPVLPWPSYRSTPAVADGIFRFCFLRILYRLVQGRRRLDQSWFREMEIKTIQEQYELWWRPLQWHRPPWP